jgi:hypothetical protein
VTSENNNSKLVIDKKRLRLFKLAAILLGTVVGLLAVELYLRGLELVAGNSMRAQLMRYNNCFERDPYLFFRLQADFDGASFNDEFQYETHTNKLHMRDFRDREHEDPTNTSKKVILALGDSFTFGTGVNIEKTFLAITEKNVDDTVILKAGVPGYNIYQYLTYLQHYGLHFKPDMVLINVFMNDLIGYGVEKRQVTEDGYLGAWYANEIQSSRFMRWNRTAFNHSALFRFLKSHGIDFHILQNIAVYAGDERHIPNHGLAGYMAEMLSIGHDKTTPYHGLYENFEKVFLEIKEILERRGIALLVNLIPCRVQVEPEVLPAMVKHYESDRFDRRLFHKKLGSILGRFGIPYLVPDRGVSDGIRQEPHQAILRNRRAFHAGGKCPDGRYPHPPLQAGTRTRRSIDRFIGRQGVGTPLLPLIPTPSRMKPSG